MNPERAQSRGCVRFKRFARHGNATEPHIEREWHMADGSAGTATRSRTATRFGDQGSQGQGRSTLKRGTVFKNIRLTSDAREIEVRDGRSTLVLKTEFLKKA